MEIPLWVQEVRVLTISMAGFCMGVLIALVPKFIRLAIKQGDSFKILPLGCILLFSIGISLLSLGAIAMVIRHWDEPLNWMSLLYLTSFTCINVVLVAVAVARDTQRWKKP